MRKTHLAIILAALVAQAPVYAATQIGDILAANHAATGGSAWNGKLTLDSEYAYSGQGLTGTTSSLVDLQRGAFVDSYDLGPTRGTSGFDGTHAWEKEQSGTVTTQEGGDVRQLAVNEVYRDQNVWWRPDHGGAQITSKGQKVDGGKTYDVLTVIPKGGNSFDAWFDSHTHLLARTVEMQVTQLITTF
jgi:hypothetical protein